MLLVLLLLLSFDNAFGYETIHLIKPNSSFESLSLNSACTVNYIGQTSYQCNPALQHKYKEKGVLNFLALGKAEGDAIDNTQNIFFEKIEENKLREILEQENFNSFSSYTEISLINKYFALNYSPNYIMSNLLVFNPAILKANVNYSNFSTLSLTSSKEVFTNPNFSFTLGASVRYISGNRLIQSFDSLDFNDNDSAQKLFEQESFNNLQSDIGLLGEFSSPFIPNWSIVAKNFGSNYQQKSDLINDDESLESLYHYSSYLKLGFGKSYNINYGDIGVEVSSPLPHKDHMDFIFEDYIVYSVFYNIEYLTLMASYNDYIQTMAINFGNEFSKIGLVFSNEREIIGFNIEDQQSTYIYFSLAFD
ncbi:hypothetical protein N9N67_00570 [Bacteriovoracaceae bacterium]|nr:hypothetical protein [Bacteriovoracaceae bacterium]